VPSKIKDFGGTPVSNVCQRTCSWLGNRRFRVSRAADLAAANAVAHRDNAAASQVFVRLYDDRFEIEPRLPPVTLRLRRQ
jgi:hypothetical protein